MIPDVVQRLIAAENNRDLDGILACVTPDVRSEHPLCPARGFVGSDQVRKNWELMFEATSAFRVELLRCVCADDVCWTEWTWEGEWHGGTPIKMGGVMILGLRDDRIAWDRIYMAEVDEAGQTLDELREYVSGQKP